MPRYLVERDFPEALAIPVDADGRHTFRIYDAPDPEAIRKVAALNGLPVNSITQVTVLDPYTYGA